jgi:hypothetical protein
MEGWREKLMSFIVTKEINTTKSEEEEEEEEGGKI